MAVVNSLTKIIQEGKAQLHVPTTVFYNPVQEFNRDLSVLVLRTFLKHDVWHHKKEEQHVKGRGGMKILDALSASGLRSIRYAKELGASGNIVKKIVANDLSKVAVDLIKENIKLNNVEDKVESSLSDAALLMHMSSASYDDRFHIIDLDPFGTGAQFFDAAVNSIGEAGLLMVTCTDTAVLCGNASESCFARYGSMSMRAGFCHEAALRIILKSIESHASVYGRYIKPLLSISVDFYVRLFIQVFSQQGETKKSASKMSQVYLCRECKTFELNRLGTYETSKDLKQAESENVTVKFKFRPSEVTVGSKCKICGGRYDLGGPIWSEPIHDSEFLKLLKQEFALEQTKEDFKTFKRIEGMIYMCSEELPNPLFYDIDVIASTLCVKHPSSKDVLSALVNAGYKVSKSHANRTGIKTNAPSNVVWDIFCQAAEKQKPSKQLPITERIMSRPRDKIYDFKFNPEIYSESKKLALLRFQKNPTRDWGPKPRPAGAKDVAANENESINKNNAEGDNKQSEMDEEHEDNFNSKRRKLSETNDNIDSGSN